MNTKAVNWGIFILLCLIWGSSFILMKLGMFTSTGTTLLSPYEVATIRILSAGLVLLPYLLTQLSNIPWSKAGYIVLSGVMGSLVPGFLFCIAETKIDSTLAGSLNALTPIFVILAGFVLYGTKVSNIKVLGIFLGLLGSALLFIVKKNANLGDLSYVLLIVLATILYGVNVNMVQRKLKGVSSTMIVAFAFSSLIIPCLLILLYTGFFKHPLTTAPFKKAVLAASVLGIIGTAFASIIFYVLMKRGGLVFASLVTYGIPFVAIGWGMVYGETINGAQVICLLIILCGVFIANLNKTKATDK
jgi:drug/metabolite transporter (DMT)-like permease